LRAIGGDYPDRYRGIETVHLEQPLVLLDQGVLRLGEDALERRLVEIFEGGVNTFPNVMLPNASSSPRM
jgi:hypothetical protein